MAAAGFAAKKEAVAIDNRFIELVTIIDDNFLNVNKEAFNILFCNESVANGPVSIFLVLSQKDNTRSSLIGKLLSYKIQSCSPLMSLTDDVSAAFLEARKFSTKKSIVAWSQPIFGELLDGKPIANIFIDIWGDFTYGMEDPHFICLSGIASTLASSVIYVQPDELTTSACNWMKNMISVLLKMEVPQKLQQLTILIQDWVKWDTHNLGAAGGASYLKGFTDAYKSKEKRKQILPAALVKDNTIEMKCYLFPKVTSDNGLNCYQHFEKFKRLVVDDGSVKQINGITLLGSESVTFLQQLPPLSLLCDFSNDEIFDLTTDDEFDADDIENTLVLTEQSTTSNQLVGNEISSCMSADVKELAINRSQIKTDNCNFRKEEKFQPFLEKTNFADDNTKHFDNSIDLVTLQDVIEMLQNPGKLTEQQIKKPSVSLVSNAGELKTLTSEEIIKNSFKQNQPEIQQYSHAACSSSQSVAVPVAELCLTAALLPTTTIGNLDHLQPNLTKLTGNQEFFKMQSNVQIFPDMTNIDSDATGPITDKQGSNLLLNQSDIEVSVATVLKSVDLESEVTITSLLKHVKQHLLTNATTGIEHTQTMSLKGIEKCLVIAVQAISNYQTAMENKIKAELCYQNDNDLITVSQDIKLVIRHEIQFSLGNALLNAVEEIIEKAERLYLKTNQNLYTQEVASFKYSLLCAEKFYLDEIERQMDTLTLLELKNIHQQVSGLSISAFMYAWDSSSSQIFKDYQHQLQQILSNHFTQFSFKLESKYNADVKLVEQNQQKSLSNFKTEVERSIRNPTFSTKEHFDKFHATAHSEALRTFKLNTAHIPNGIQDKYTPILEKKLQDAYNDKQTDIVKKISRLSISITNQPSSSPQMHKTYTKPNTNVDSANRLASVSVGIHFSLDTLSVNTIQNGNFRSLYGPHENVISFGKEVLIGRSRTPGDDILQLRDILLTEDITTLYSFPAPSKYSLRMEEIVAFVFAKIHQIVKSKLNTSSIFYIIAWPTFFNKIQLQAIDDAVQIAGINAHSVRETCGLAFRYFLNGVFSQDQTRYLVAVEDEKTDSCDISMYTFENRKLKLDWIFGSNEKIPFLYGNNTPGILGAVENVKKLLKNQIVPDRIVLQSSDERRVRNKNIIQSHFPSATLYFTVTSDIVEGSSGLASHFVSPERSHNVMKNLSFSGIIKKDNEKFKNLNSRIEHKGKNIDGVTLFKMHEFVKSTIEKDHRWLEQEKEKAKQRCHQLSNDIQNNDAIPSKNEIQESISKSIREIEAEPLSAGNVWRKVEFITNLIKGY